MREAPRAGSKAADCDEGVCASADGSLLGGAPCTGSIARRLTFVRSRCRRPSGGGWLAVQRLACRARNILDERLSRTSATMPALDRAGNCARRSKRRPFSIFVVALAAWMLTFIGLAWELVHQPRRPATQFSEAGYWAGGCAGRGSKSNVVNPSESTAEASTTVAVNSRISAYSPNDSIPSLVPQRLDFRFSTRKASRTMYW